MIVDESKNGLVKGEFVWTVGDGEVEVLERFMQECEFSMGWYKGDRVRDGVKEVVRWGWTAEELAGKMGAVGGRRYSCKIFTRERNARIQDIWACPISRHPTRCRRPIATW